MKKIFHYYILGILLLLSCSLVCCKKDFLERAPSDLIDEEKVFTNLDNAEAFLNTAYREVPQLVYRTDNSRASYFNLGSATDEAGGMWGASKSGLDFNNGNWNAVSFPLDWTWFAYYSSIRKINVFLANYDRIPNEVGGQTANGRKERMLGEAHGLRAYYYFLLYSMWGEVPLITEALLPGGSDNVYLPRSSATDIIAAIDADLQIAMQYLPATHTDGQFGRFTKTAAKALLSRVYLYYASALSNPVNDRQRWEKAEAVTKDAIDYAETAGYALSLSASGGKKPYERIFLEMENSETIWSCASPYDGNGSYWDFWSGSLSQGGWYGEAPVQDLVDAYEVKNGEIPVLGYRSDGSPIINEKADYNPSAPFENRDERFYQTILYQGAMWKGRAINVAPGGADYSNDKPRINYFWRKYTMEEHNLYSGDGMAERRFVVFRMGELLLNYAEARNEVLGSPDATVYDAINQLRRRGGLPDLPLGLSQTAMRERIRHERRIELVMENHRFFDVRRWMIAEEVDNHPVRKIHVSASGNFTYPIWGNRVFEKKHYLFPIPQLEIEKSSGVLTQNPGWQ